MKILEKYLQSGGNLIASGEDIGYNINSFDFYSDYLHAKYIKDKSSSKDITGMLMKFSLDGSNCADNQNYPDVIKPLQGAKSILEYGNNEGCAAISYKGDYKVVYLGFGLEGVDTKINRKKLMDKLLRLVKPSLSDNIMRYSYLGKHGASARVLDAYMKALANRAEKLSTAEASKLLDTIRYNSDFIGTRLKEALINKVRE